MFRKKFTRKLTSKPTDQEEQLKIIDESETWFAKSKGALEESSLPPSAPTAENDLVK